MLSKNLLQTLLLLIVVLISYFFFKVYFDNNEIEKKSTKSIIIKSNNSNEKSNLIKSIKYKSIDDNGNSYIVTADSGKIDEETPEIILMNKVFATINLIDAAPINISSENAVFNKLTYDTNFDTNVLVLYDGNSIQSLNLDLYFQKNLALISNEITYIGLNTELQADKIELDLLTKNSKIFMNDNSKKIKILTTN